MDFGGHRAEFFSFKLEGVGHSVDGPVRLRLTFGQTAGDWLKTLILTQGR
jgi:hypothetical protein